MKESLIIKNFGPITNIEIELKKINIFIGEQGVGKSTVAKLYSCLQDFSLHIFILSGRNQDKIKESFKRYGIHSYFNDDTYIRFQSSTNYIVIYEQGLFKISHLTYDELEMKIDVIDSVMKSLKHSFDVAGIKLNADLDKFPEKEAEVIISNLRTSLYLPAERSIAACVSSSLTSLILADVPLPKMLLEFLSFFEKAKNEYQIYKVPFLNLAFKTINNEDKIQIGDKEIDFKYCSSGIQSIVPMLMIIDYCMKQDYFNCFALEEPELNLFPTNQLELTRFIISKINQENGIDKLIITTHSPYILSILNVSILAGKISAMNSMVNEEVSSILKPEYHLQASDVEVFSLGKQINGKNECESILDASTGLIKGNYLDAVSSFISADFNRLNRLYIKTLREQ